MIIFIQREIYSRGEVRRVGNAGRARSRIFRSGDRVIDRRGDKNITDLDKADPIFDDGASRTVWEVPARISPHVSAAYGRVEL